MSNQEKNESITIEEFPPEILSKIFDSLESFDLRNCRLVNKTFSEVIGNFNREKLGSIELIKDWGVSRFLTSVISNENGHIFTNFILAIKYLSGENVEKFASSQGEYVKNLKIFLHPAKSSEEYAEKLIKILNSTSNLRTLIFSYCIKNDRDRYFHKIKVPQYLPPQLNLDSFSALKTLRMLSFKGITLSKRHLPIVQSFVSKVPHLKKFEFVISGKHVLTNEFKSLVPYLKKPLISLTIFRAKESEQNIFKIIVDSLIKIEEFGITTNWTSLAREEVNAKERLKIFYNGLMDLLHANSQTLKNFKFYGYFMSTLNLSQFPAIKSLTLIVHYYYRPEIFKDIEEFIFPQDLRKIEISDETLLIFVKEEIVLPSVQELIINDIYTHGVDIGENGENRKYLNWSLIFPNVQVIRLTNSTTDGEIYAVEQMGANLKELDIRSSVQYKSSLWNVLVRADMNIIGEGKLFDILEEKKSGEDVNFENIIPENFVPRVRNLKKLQKLRLFSNEILSIAEDFFETLVFLSVSKWLQPLDFILINVPLSYKGVHPPSFLQFLQDYHKNVQISYSLIKEERWPDDVFHGHRDNSDEENDNDDDDDEEEEDDD